MPEIAKRLELVKKTACLRLNRFNELDISLLAPSKELVFILNLIGCPFANTILTWLYC
jgi:hypothetical protein